MIFSIWIGGKPPQIAMDCMEWNNDKHGLTLIASENWVNAKEFITIDPMIDEALTDPRCKALWDAFTEPEFRSDVLRLWWLMKHPEAVYADSDCVLYSLPEKHERVMVPSIQSTMQDVARRAGGVLDMDEVRNSTGEFVDVFVIAGNGDAGFFDAWLTRWAELWARPGGIGDALIYEPVELGILPAESYTHFGSTSRNKRYR